VPNTLFKPPKQLVDEWPEVFSDLYMNTMPVNYLEYIHLEFSSGMVWELDVKDQLKHLDPDVVSQRLYETIQEYKDQVIKFNFKLDVNKLKKDIKKSSRQIL
jgi:hypothetical protein